MYTNCRSLFVALILLLMSAAVVNAQSVTVGTGTDVVWGTFYQAYAYVGDASLYLSSEISASGTITGLKRKTAAPGGNATNVSIYCKDISSSTVETNQATIIAGATLVYSGTVTAGSTDGAFYEVTLSTPFPHDNAYNLEVYVESSNPPLGGSGIMTYADNLADASCHAWDRNNSSLTTLSPDVSRPPIEFVGLAPSITIGTGTTLTWGTFYQAVSFASDASLYLSSEIPQSGTITSLQWKSGSPDGNATNVSIYCKDISSSTVETDRATLLDGATLVYSGTVTAGSIDGAFHGVTLSTPFAHNNAYNLEVYVESSNPPLGDSGIMTYVDELADGSRHAWGCSSSSMPSPSPDIYRPAIRLQMESLLPVELTSFTAAVHQDGVVLQWQTATEVNNAGFEIERRNNNTNAAWRTVAFVAGHGTSNILQRYCFTDQPGAGTFAYRLKQIDRDGAFAYSHTCEAACTEQLHYGLQQNQPNPFNPSTTIHYTLPAPSHVRLTVFDALGRQVAELLYRDVPAGQQKIQWNAAVASGIYFYKMEAVSLNDPSQRFADTKKMILLRYFFPATAEPAKLPAFTPSLFNDQG